MNKPPIPPITCPHIDRVMDLIDDILELKDNKSLLENQIDIIKAELEFIRTSNDQLRIASKHWHDLWSKSVKTQKSKSSR
jgi:hypothetical protein